MGMGAVMGDKNLKAIAVRGSKDIQIARPMEFIQHCNEALKYIEKRDKNPIPNVMPILAGLGSPQEMAIHDEQWHTENFMWGNARERRKGFWTEEIQEVWTDTMETMRSRLQQLTAELRRRHAESAAILTGIVEGVWSVDRERRITWMNPQAAESLGIGADQALGRFCGDVLRPTLPDGGRPCESSCPIVDARFRGSARATEHLATPGGRRRTVVITSASIAEESEGDDRDTRQFQVMRDETEEEAVRRLRDAVLANVSHEFRTPLSAQLASLEMLRERVDERVDPPAAELVRSMERGTLRLVRLVDNLLESLRIDAGRDSIRRRPVDLRRVIQESIDQVLPLLVQKRQTLDSRLPGEIPEIDGDAPRLVQVFTNLLVNAGKFSPPGSTVAIGGRVSDREVTLWVEDQGPGFPDDPEDRRFERFSRATSGEPDEGGVGLGLYIANSIVERHGGTLHARNKEPGAWIAVVLPRTDSHEDPGGG
jgi:signal transduction histidine kinase